MAQWFKATHLFNPTIAPVEVTSFTNRVVRVQLDAKTTMEVRRVNETTGYFPIYEEAKKYLVDAMYDKEKRAQKNLEKAQQALKDVINFPDTYEKRTGSN